MEEEGKQKQKPIRRLKSVSALRAKVDESYKRGIEAMESGEPTAWVMANFWEVDPIIKAMGLEAVYPENYGAVCASTEVVWDYLERAEQEGFPAHLCGYARNCLGYTARMVKDCRGNVPPEAPAGGMPLPRLLISTGAACDARYKWFEALGHYIDAPQVTIDMPNPGAREMFCGEDTYQQAVDLIVHELRDFVRFLERFLKRKMDWDRLGEIVDGMIEICRVWHETNELRKAVPCPMHSRDFFSAMPPALFLMGDLRETLACYRDLYEEVKFRAENGIGAVGEERYRLLFAELPPWHSLGFFDKLAERGWNFVHECQGWHPPIPEDFRDVGDPLRRIAQFAFQWIYGLSRDCGASGQSCYQAYHYLKWVREFSCDGILMHPVRSCRTATVFLPHLQNTARESLSVPSLMVEGDIVDLRLFDPGEALRKAEAFEDVMEHYRELRRGTGN